MKNICLLAGVCGLALTSTNALAEEKQAAAYGDLYNVQWCPCNPEDQFNDNGSVVMGKTVMCPCDSLYSGYKKGLDEDLRDIKTAANNQLRKLNYFKYYIGMDYNIASQSAVSAPLTFDDIRFASAPIEISPADIIQDQDTLSFVMGARVSKYFGLEAFYESTYEDNNNTQIDNHTLNAGTAGYYLMNDYTTSYSAYGLDIIGYIPVSAYFDFVGALGLAQYSFDNRATFGVYHVDNSALDTIINKDFSEDKIGWRAAVGAQVNIAEGVALRGMYRYVSIGGDVIDDISEVSLGVRFLF